MTVEPNSPENRAFVSTPDPSRYFPAAAVEDARKRVVRAIMRSEGPALVCGAAGLGKSLLLAMLDQWFSGQLCIVSVAASQVCSRRELLQTILFRLDQSYRGLEDGEMRLSILEYLTAAEGASRKLLLLVDDADMLPAEVFDELRGLLSVVHSGAPLVHLVLAGSAALEERLAEPALDGLSQRLSVRCYLSPLSRDETYQYVRSQVAAIGSDPNALFEAAALEAVFSATDGVPRLVNQLGDQLMCAAEEMDRTPLDGDAVQQVWSELQQLPTPREIVRPAVAALPVDQDFVDQDVVDQDVIDQDVVEHLVDDLDDDLDDAGVIEFGLLDDEADLAAVPVAAADDDQPASLGLGDLTSVQFAFEDREETERAVRPSIERADDDTPASIPFAAKLSSADCIVEKSPPAEAGRGFSFADPFADSFAEEEALVNRYALFETELLKSAPSVVNRLDGAFAGDLLRAVAAPLASARTAMPIPAPAPLPQVSAPAAELRAARQSASPASLADDQSEPCVAISATRAPQPIEFLVVEDDGRGAHKVVPSRQFRRLFSQLESARVG